METQIGSIVDRLDSQLGSTLTVGDVKELEERQTFKFNKARFEEAVLEVSSPSGPPVSVARFKKENKAAIKQRIKDMCAAKGIACDMDELDKMKKPELIERLGELLRSGMEALEQEQSIAEDVAICEEVGVEYKKDISIDIAAKTLYGFNLLIASALHSINENVLKDTTHASIRKYPEHLEQNKTELLEIYALIYQEYKTDIGKYLTPIHTAILINGRCLISSVEVEKKSSTDL
jgi:hypothetical protein